MFSGIVEEAAQVVALEREQENLHITLSCSFAGELKIDQSVAHNGVCLTVVRKGEGTYTVTAIQETLDRSNLGDLRVGDKVNVERSMMMNGRLDGHIVQGHVDQTATCTDVAEEDGRIVRFRDGRFTDMPDMLRGFVEGRYVHDRPEYPLTFDQAMGAMSKGRIVECDLGSCNLFALRDGVLMHASHGEDKLTKAVMNGRLLTAKWRVVL